MWGSVIAFIWNMLMKQCHKFISSEPNNSLKVLPLSMTTMGITFPHEFWKKPYNHHRCLLGKMWTGSLKAPRMELRKNSIAFGPSYFVLVERTIEISFRFSFTIKTFSWPSLIICECLNLPHKMIACGLLRNCSVERMK